MPHFLARRALIMIALSTVTLGVMCDQVCLEAQRQTNLTLTCSGGYKSDFKHVYWKAGSHNKSIASCYNSNTECYIHDGLRYWADRADLNDTVFESSLLVENLGNNIVIKCFLWAAGWENEMLINTTRVLVDRDCGQPAIEEFLDIGTPVNATTGTPVNATTGTPVNAISGTPVNAISDTRGNKLRINSDDDLDGFTKFFIYLYLSLPIIAPLILIASCCAPTVYWGIRRVKLAMERRQTSIIPLTLDPKDNPLKKDPAILKPTTYPKKYVSGRATSWKNETGLLSADDLLQDQTKKSQTTAAISVSSPTAEDEAPIIEMQDRCRQLRQLTVCKICMDKELALVFLPCGHLVTCSECGSALRNCPICRVRIKRVVQTFL